MDDERNRIRLLQYVNLRNCFNKYLIEPILDKEYYNHMHDVYTCDKEICEDIKYKYESMRKDLKYTRIFFVLSMMANVCWLIYYFTK